MQKLSEVPSFSLTNQNILQNKSQNLPFNNVETQQKKEKCIKESEQISISLEYLKQRIIQRFSNQVVVRKTKSYLVDSLNVRVNTLLKKYNLGQNNILYDELQRLNDRVNQDIQKKQYTYTSTFKVADDFSNFQQILQQIPKMITFNNIETITLYRQKDKLNEILMTPHKVEKLISNEIHLNTYNETILDKLFIEKQLFSALLQYITENKNAEQLFRKLELFESNHKIEMRLLVEQFKNINNKQNNSQKCEQIIRNTVNYLENEQLKQIGHLDLQNLNRKFKEIYLPYLQDVDLYQSGSYYPTGILFILMRCGRIGEAQKLLSAFKSSEQFQVFNELQQLKCINQTDVERYSKTSYDILMQQCLWLLLDVSEAFSLFEERKIPGDKDLYIWMILRTTHFNSDFVQYEKQEYESKKSFFHWTLTDLQESIPENNVGLRMNLILQRYDYFLNELFKQHNACVVQVEYFILDLVLKSLNLRNDTRQQQQQSKWIVENLVSSSQNKNPIVSCLILRAFSYDIQMIATLLSKGQHLMKLLTDKQIKDNLETIFGEESLLSITNQTINQYFRNTLHSSFKEFIINLEKSSALHQINDSYNKLIGKIDEITIYLKLLLQKSEELLIQSAITLYQETQFLLIFCIVISTNYCIQKLGIQYQHKNMQARQLENLHQGMKSTAKQYKLNNIYLRLLIIEIFQNTLLMLQSEKASLGELIAPLNKFNMCDLTKSLLDDGQVEILKMMFWQLWQLLDKFRYLDSASIKSLVKEMSGVLLRNPESKGLRICEKELELTQGCADILNRYQKILQQY